MEWNQETTRAYLTEHGISYSEYETVYGETLLFDRDPYSSMLTFGKLGDRCDRGRIVHEMDRDTLIVEDDGVFSLVGRDGAHGDAQIGGTLDEFIAYLDAWSSMYSTPGPFANTSL